MSGSRGIEFDDSEASLTWGYVAESLRCTPGHRAALLREYMRAIEASAGDTLPSALTIGGRSFQVNSDLMQRLDLLPGVDAALLDLTNPKIQTPEGRPSKCDQAVQPTETLESEAGSHVSVGDAIPNPGLVPVPTAAARACMTQEPPSDSGKRLKPPQVFPTQEAEILKAIREIGHEPKSLPPIKAGKPWVKSEVWQKIGICQLFASQRVFNKAWERLRASTQIAERCCL